MHIASAIYWSAPIDDKDGMFIRRGLGCEQVEEYLHGLHGRLAARAQSSVRWRDARSRTMCPRVAQKPGGRWPRVSQRTNRASSLHESIPRNRSPKHSMAATLLPGSASILRCAALLCFARLD